MFDTYQICGPSQLLNDLRLFLLRRAENAQEVKQWMNPGIKRLGQALGQQRGPRWTLNKRLISLLATIVHRQEQNIWCRAHQPALNEFLLATKPHSLSKPCLTGVQKRLIEDTASTFLVALLDRLYDKAPLILPPAPWVPALYFKYDSAKPTTYGAWSAEGLFAGGALNVNYTNLGWTLFAAEPLHNTGVFTSSQSLLALEVSLQNTIMMEIAYALLTLLISRRDTQSEHSEPISRSVYDGIVFDTLRDANACVPVTRGSANSINSKGNRTTKNPAWRPGLLVNSV